MFSSDRPFKIFSYSISHGPLLLRSMKSRAAPTRLDVLFQDVRAMEIRCFFDGLKINEVSTDFLKGFASDPTDMLEPGLKVYDLQGKGWSGYILGGIVRTHEDEGGPMEPSKLLGN